MGLPETTESACPCSCGLFPLRTGARLAAVAQLMVAAVQLMMVLWWLDADNVPLEKWAEDVDVYYNAGFVVVAVRLT